ncbi:MAG TPA: oligosaccharide flippase family protein, partial [Candidatus Thermoplasmatota archaeon]|nr:oligosaccharide flippase family protein [Candidatus Thermoplasmatota archaeon]
MATLADPPPVEATAPPVKADGLGRNVAHLLGATGLTRVGGFLYHVALRRVLDPALVGVLNLAQIAVSYLSAVTVGVHYSGERLVSRYRALDDAEGVARVRRAVLSWTLAECAALGAVLLAYALLAAPPDPSTRAALLAVPFLFVANRLIAVYYMLFKSAKRFTRYARVTVVAAAMDWSLLAWAYFLGLPGLFAGAVVMGAAKVAYLHALATRQDLVPRPLRPALGGWREHWPYGPRYAVFKALWTVGERVDSLLVAYFAGPVGVAFYFLGYQLAQILMEVPLAISYVAFPTLVEGDATSARRFSRDFFRYLSLTLFVAIPATVGVAFFAADPLVRHALPAFAPAVPVVKIAIAAVSVLGLRYLYYHVLTVHGRLGRLTAITALHLPVLVVAAAASAAILGDPLLGVAVGAFAAAAAHLAV